MSLLFWFSLRRKSRCARDRSDPNGERSLRYRYGLPFAPTVRLPLSDTAGVFQNALLIFQTEHALRWALPELIEWLHTTGGALGDILALDCKIEHAAQVSHLAIDGGAFDFAGWILP